MTPPTPTIGGIHTAVIGKVVAGASAIAAKSAGAKSVGAAAPPTIMIGGAGCWERERGGSW